MNKTPLYRLEHLVNEVCGENCFKENLLIVSILLSAYLVILWWELTQLGLSIRVALFPIAGVLCFSAWAIFFLLPWEYLRVDPGLLNELDSYLAHYSPFDQDAFLHLKKEVERKGKPTPVMLRSFVKAEKKVIEDHDRATQKQQEQNAINKRWLFQKK